MQIVRHGRFLGPTQGPPDCSAGVHRSIGGYAGNCPKTVRRSNSAVPDSRKLLIRWRSLPDSNRCTSLESYNKTVSRLSAAPAITNSIDLAACVYPRSTVRWQRPFSQSYSCTRPQKSGWVSAGKSGPSSHGREGRSGNLVQRGHPASRPGRQTLPRQAS